MAVDVIFQPTDLVGRRVEFLAAARRGLARLRDKDGTGLVMIPETRFDLLQTLSTWAIARLRLERLIAEQERASVEDLDLGWLRVFEVGDLRSFSKDLRDAMLAAQADQDAAPLDDVIETWRSTARRIVRGSGAATPPESESSNIKFAKWRDVRAALETAPPDEEFRADLEEIRAMSRGEMPRDAWGQS